MTDYKFERKISGIKFQEKASRTSFKIFVPNTPCHKEPNDNNNKKKSAAI